MRFDLDSIPGYTAAVAFEAAARARAFLEVPRDLCGVEVVDLTLHRLAILEVARSPFLCGGEVTDASMAVFLWIVSTGFQPAEEEARNLFIACLREREHLANLADCARQIGDYLDEMFLDSPPNGAGQHLGDAPVTGPEAMYCDIFGSQYGWTDEKTMHTGLPRLHQLIRRITLRADPKACFGNRRSDKVRGDWQRAQKVK